MYYKSYEKTSYELWHGRAPTMKFFKIFKSKFYIWIDEDDLGKFKNRSNEDIFLGYFVIRETYQCYNNMINKVVESVNMRFGEGLKKNPKILLIMNMILMKRMKMRRRKKKKS